MRTGNRTAAGSSFAWEKTDYKKLKRSENGSKLRSPERKGRRRVSPNMSEKASPWTIRTKHGGYDHPGKRAI